MLRVKRGLGFRVQGFGVLVCRVLPKALINLINPGPQSVYSAELIMRIPELNGKQLEKKLQLRC